MTLSKEKVFFILDISKYECHYFTHIMFKWMFLQWNCNFLLFNSALHQVMSWWHQLTTYYHCSLILMTSYVFSRPHWIGHLGLIRSSVSRCHAIGKYWYPELKCRIMITMKYNFSKTFERPIYIIELSVKVMNKYLSMGSELYILQSHTIFALWWDTNKEIPGDIIIGIWRQERYFVSSEAEKNIFFLFRTVCIS